MPRRFFCISVLDQLQQRSSRTSFNNTGEADAGLLSGIPYEGLDGVSVRQPDGRLHHGRAQLRHHARDRLHHLAHVLIEPDALNLYLGTASQAMPDLEMPTAELCGWINLRLPNGYQTCANQQHFVAMLFTRGALWG